MEIMANPLNEPSIDLSIKGVVIQDIVQLLQSTFFDIPKAHYIVVADTVFKKIGANVGHVALVNIFLSTQINIQKCCHGGGRILHLKGIYLLLLEGNCIFKENRKNYGIDIRHQTCSCGCGVNSTIAFITTIIIAVYFTSKAAVNSITHCISVQ